MASYVGRAQGVNVLLVEHDINHLISTKQMLEFLSHKVKCVQHASVALSVLSNGNDQFDLVMANISSPDSCTFKLLQTAIKMGLEVILVCEYDDEMAARTALEQGALLFLCKPIKMENVKYLWQHVWREKTRKIAHTEQLGDPHNVTTLNRMSHGIRVEEEIPVENVATHCNGDDKNNHNSMNNVRREKVWIEWTRELHRKFVDAIVQLGEGKCYPQDILELMNVPGLTRLQVASHLQKCRSGTWRPRDGGKRHYHRRAVESSEDDATKGKRKRFGCMPTFYEHIEQQNLHKDRDIDKENPQIYDARNDNNGNSNNVHV